MNNTSKNTNATSATNNAELFAACRKYETVKILLPVSVKKTAYESLREVVFNLIVANTAKHTNVTMEYLEYLMREFNKFANAMVVNIEIAELDENGKEVYTEKNTYHFGAIADDEFGFTTDANFTKLLKVVEIIDRLGIYYEDKVTNGFCCSFRERKISTHVKVTYDDEI